MRQPRRRRGGHVHAPVGGFEPWAGIWIWRADRPHSPLHLAPGASIIAIALNPDGSRLISVGETAGETAGVIVWDTRTGERLRRLDDRLAFPAYSADGRWIILSNRQPEPIRILAADGKEAEREFPGRRGFLAPDGKLFAIIKDAQTLSLLDPVAGSELARFNDAEVGGINEAYFTPNGVRLVMKDSQRGIGILDLRRLRQELSDRGMDWEGEPCALKRHGPNGLRR